MPEKLKSHNRNSLKSVSAVMVFYRGKICSCKLQIILYLSKSGIAIILTKTQDEPKPIEISRNEPKTAKKTLRKYETATNDLKFQNWGNLGLSTIFHYLNFEPKCPNLDILGKKVSTF